MFATLSIGDHLLTICPSDSPVAKQLGAGRAPIDGEGDHIITVTDQWSNVTARVLRHENDAGRLLAGFLIVDDTDCPPAVLAEWRAAFPQQEFNP